MWRIDISMGNNYRNRFLWAIKQIRIHMQTSRSFNIATLGLKKGWIDEKKSEDIICQWMNASASIFFNDFGHWLNHKLYAYSKYLVKHILHSLNMVLHFSLFLFLSFFSSQKYLTKVQNKAFWAKTIQLEGKTCSTKMLDTKSFVEKKKKHRKYI